MSQAEALVLRAIGNLQRVGTPPPTQKAILSLLKDGPDAESYISQPHLDQILRRLKRWPYPVLHVESDAAGRYPKGQAPNVYTLAPHVANDHTLASLALVTHYYHLRDPRLLPESELHYYLYEVHGLDPDLSAKFIQLAVICQYLTTARPTESLIILPQTCYYPTPKIQMEFLYLVATAWPHVNHDPVLHAMLAPLTKNIPLEPPTPRPSPARS
jgi:hypothetical protein